MATDEEFLRATIGSMDLVYNVARGLTRHTQDAEDLVQETYLAALRAWRERRRPRNVEPWLATICLNLGRSGFRRRSRRPIEVALEGVEAAADSDPAEEALRALDRSEVQRAMWSLPDEQRIAVSLVDVVGFSTAEAAELMRTPRGTVLSRVHRGRRALREALSREAPRP